MGILIPLLGILGPALLHILRGSRVGVEEEQFRKVLNFLVSYLIYQIAIRLLFPRDAAEVMALILALFGLVMLIYNGFLTLRGGSVEYTFSIPVSRAPRGKRLSVEEMMYQQKD